MRNRRIVERTYKGSSTCYVIQERHFIFRWWWVDAWVNRSVGFTDTFDTMEKALEALARIDKKAVDRILSDNDIRRVVSSERVGI